MLHANKVFLETKEIIPLLKSRIFSTNKAVLKHTSDSLELSPILKKVTLRNEILRLLNQSINTFTVPPQTIHHFSHTVPREDSSTIVEESMLASWRTNPLEFWRNQPILSINRLSISHAPSLRLTGERAFSQY